MTDKKDGMTVGEWHQAIAQKAKSTPEAIATALDNLNIRPKPVLPRVRTLNLVSVRMEGVKHEKEQQTPFTFDWSGLSGGLWALLSEGNSKGKSSTLAVVRAALQGRFPGKIKRDVWSWIEGLRVEFEIDGVPYITSLRKHAGETDETVAQASLVRRSDGTELSLYEGLAGEKLSEAIEAVFMDELGFDRFQAFRSAKATVVEHGWSSMSSALFIAGPGSAVFGDHTEDGLPIRLIQMFIGLPWVSTYTAISTAHKRLKSEHEKAKGTNATETLKIRTRLAELEGQKKDRQTRLAALPSRHEMRTEISMLDQQLAASQATVVARRTELNIAQTLANESSVAHLNARRLLQQAKDDLAAGYVFRKLQPVCCPACEASFKPGRFAEANTRTCGLCGDVDTDHDSSDTDGLTHLEAAVADSGQVRDSAEQALQQVQSTLRYAEGSRDSVQQRLSEISATLSTSDESEQLSREIVGLEARIEELGAMLAGPAETTFDEDETLRILSAAEAVTKSAMESLQAEIMKEVGDQIFNLAERFGVRNLEEFSFKAHRMDLRQGGVNVTFTGLNAGENLRIRVAAALATLQVARSRGYGRHPGLLVLDSPAASEMSVADFAALIEAVSKTVEEIPGIQVIVGALARPELDSVIPLDRRRVAIGSDTLF